MASHRQFSQPTKCIVYHCVLWFSCCTCQIRFSRFSSTGKWESMNIPLITIFTIIYFFSPFHSLFYSVSQPFFPTRNRIISLPHTKYTEMKYFADTSNITQMKIYEPRESQFLLIDLYT